MLVPQDSLQTTTIFVKKVNSPDILQPGLKCNACFLSVQVRPQCLHDNECPDTHACLSGSCQHACHIEDCGSYAQCTASNHRAQCTCPHGMTGNPKVACTPSMYPVNNVIHSLSVFPLVLPVTQPVLENGCSDDNDCPDYTACRNRLCINPCAVDDPCAPSAKCLVSKHKAVCSCPDGYVGTPEISCEKRKLKVNLLMTKPRIHGGGEI